MRLWCWFSSAIITQLNVVPHLRHFPPNAQICTPAAEQLARSAHARLRNVSLSPRRRLWRVPSCKERAWTLFNVSEGIDSSDTQLWRRLFLWGHCEGNKRSLSLRSSVYDSFKSTSANRASPPVLLVIARDGPDEPYTLQRKCFVLKLSLCFSVCKFFISTNMYLFLKIERLAPLSPF